MLRCCAVLPTPQHSTAVPHSQPLPRTLTLAPSHAHAAPQGTLVRYIGRLRAATAAQTDERVRLTGEAINGVLAMKMLGGWVRGACASVVCVRGRRGGACGRMLAPQCDDGAGPAPLPPHNPAHLPTP